MAITLLLSTQPHNYSEQLGNSRQAAVPPPVHQAREYIDANPREGTSLAALDAWGGVTARSLPHGVRAFLD